MVEHMPTLQDKINGFFLGTMIGDTYGKPVEMWKADQIALKHGRLTEILSPADHKFFREDKIGTWSDDTQLTLAVANALIESDGVSDLDRAMEAQVKWHVQAIKESTNGWGGTTRNALRALANGKHWSESGLKGIVNGKPQGFGNGVAMKIGPAGAFLAFQGRDIWTEQGTGEIWSEVVDFVTNLSMMTHQTSISASAALAQMAAVYYCLSSNPQTFNVIDLISKIISSSSLGALTLPVEGPDDITERLELLNDHQNYDKNRIISEFGGGGCYCYHSVPFTLMFFVKNPMNVESLYDVVNAGGDTDSNGSMLAALLGALHGPSVFPTHLVDALDATQKAVLLDVADRFYKKFVTEG